MIDWGDYSYPKELKDVPFYYVGNADETKVLIEEE